MRLRKERPRMSDEIEITPQEIQRILLAALDCLNSGKINNARAKRITDTANFAISAMQPPSAHDAAQRRRREVSQAATELQEAEEMLARLSKPSEATQDAHTRRQGRSAGRHRKATLKRDADQATRPKLDDLGFPRLVTQSMHAQSRTAGRIALGGAPVAQYLHLHLSRRASRPQPRALELSV